MCEVLTPLHGNIIFDEFAGDFCAVIFVKTIRDSRD